MDACRICDLIFDTPALELGRATSDPTICCICEEHNMATIETVTETVTQEFFILKYTRAELETFVDEPTPYLRDIRDVLNGSNKKPLKRAKPAPVRTAKPAKPDKKIKPLLQCKHGCGATFITAGRKSNHEAICIDNPERIIPE